MPRSTQRYDSRIKQKKGGGRKSAFGRYLLRALMAGFFCQTLMNGKSYMVKLTIVDEESLQALDRCKENRKIPVLLSHAVYDFVRTEEGKKILDRLAPRNRIEKNFC